MIIESVEVVLGDIIILESGMSVPADVRILESNDLQINESVFTGEWLSVKKYKYNSRRFTHNRTK